MASHILQKKKKEKKQEKDEDEGERHFAFNGITKRHTIVAFLNFRYFQLKNISTKFD